MGASSKRSSVAVGVDADEGAEVVMGGGKLRLRCIPGGGCEVEKGGRGEWEGWWLNGLTLRSCRIAPSTPIEEGSKVINLGGIAFWNILLAC